MKKVLVIALGICAAGSLYAGLGEWLKKATKAVEDKDISKAGEIFSEGAAFASQAKVYPADTDINFELKNKSNKPVFFVIKSGGEAIKNKDGNLITEVPAGKTIGQNIDYNKKTEVSIWQNRPASASDAAEKVYEVQKRRTIYVTWDGVTLRPQTGPAGGKLNKTDTGLSKENNIKKDEIKLVSGVAKVAAPVAPTPPQMAAHQ